MHFIALTNKEADIGKSRRSSSGKHASFAKLGQGTRERPPSSRPAKVYKPINRQLNSSSSLSLFRSRPTSSLQSPAQKLTAGETMAAPRSLAALLTPAHSAAAAAGVRSACVGQSMSVFTSNKSHAWQADAVAKISHVHKERAQPLAWKGALEIAHSGGVLRSTPKGRGVSPGTGKAPPPRDRGSRAKGEPPIPAFVRT